jgi:hypothetical protein
VWRFLDHYERAGRLWTQAVAPVGSWWLEGRWLCPDETLIIPSLFEVCDFDKSARRWDGPSRWLPVERGSRERWLERNGYSEEMLRDRRMPDWCSTTGWALDSSADGTAAQEHEWVDQAWEEEPARDWTPPPKVMLFQWPRIGQSRRN